MINEVANVIKSRFEPLKQNGTITSLHGMSKIIYTTHFSNDKPDSIPVPINYSDIIQCCDNPMYSLIPRGKGVRSIVYFEEVSSSKQESFDSSMDSSLMKCQMRLICWYNEVYFANPNDNSIPDVNSLLSAKFIEILSNNNDSLNNKLISSLKVSDISIVSIDDSFGVFSKYSYMIDKYNFLIRPYGFFSISFNCKYSIDHECLPQLTFDNSSINC